MKKPPITDALEILDRMNADVPGWERMKREARKRSDRQERWWRFLRWVSFGILGGTHQ